MVNTSKKYEDILKTARDLFWKYGFKRVSIEEICRKANASKMTFYRFFPNKTELARCVFDHEANRGVADFKAIMTENAAPAEKIKKIMLLKLNGTNDISHEFLMDFYNNPELGLKDHIEETTRRIWTEILEDFKRAQADGTFRKDFKPEFLLYLSQKIADMMNDEKIASLFNNPQDMIMELTSFFVYGISPHE
jgi:AcrR family transcriptional regulator